MSITGAGAAESWAACDDGGGGNAGSSGMVKVVEVGKQEGRVRGGGDTTNHAVSASQFIGR